MKWVEDLVAKASTRAAAERPAEAITDAQPEPREITVTIRNASRGDPGEIAIGSYTVRAGKLVVLDEGGSVIGQRDGADPVTPIGADIGERDRVAREILRSKWSGFNRRIEYPRLSTP